MIVKYGRSILLSLAIAIFVVAGCSPFYKSKPIEPFGISVENAAHLEHVATYGEGQALEISLSPDGHWMAVRSTIGVRLFDTQTWEAVELDRPYQSVSHMAFSPDGKLLAIRIPCHKRN